MSTRGRFSLHWIIHKVAGLRMLLIGRGFMWSLLSILLTGSFILVFLNEYLIHYMVLLQCQWPLLDPMIAETKIQEQPFEPLKAMFLADTHLLGTQDGHWFDQLRREWQMERGFQSAMAIHKPDVVFILGDALDEGKWSNDQDFRDYVKRFKRIFATPEGTDINVLAGNHDIGFHYMIDEHKRRRFSSAFSSPSVRKLIIRGNVFVLLNSMAMEGDGCHMCAAAEKKLEQISKSLKCSQGLLDSDICSEEEKFIYSQPILLQHFPMYRESDSECSGPDEAPPDLKFKKMVPKYDCLSEEASQKLLDWISPRFIITAHTHFGCFKTHRGNIPEWTIPSFSWRNINQPAFILARISSNNFAIEKCFMPRESTVIYLYIFGGIVILFYLLLSMRALSKSRALKKS